MSKNKVHKDERTILETGQKTVVEGYKTEVEDRQSSSGASAISSFRDYPIIEQFPATGGEADIYLIKQKSGEAILKLYRFGVDPKEAVLKKAKELSINFPEHIIGIDEYGYDEKTQRWYEIQEHAKHGSLRDYAASNFNKKELRKIIEEIIEGLKVLNDNDLLHLDLKPSNILVRTIQPLDLILTDFGIASILDPDLSKKMTKIKGTPLFWSPEAFTGVVGKQSDFWSLGIIILELLMGKNPFSDLDTKVIMYTLSTRGVEIPENIGEDFKLLLKGLLTREPQKRWGYEQVKRWLQGDRDIPTYYVLGESSEGKYRKSYKFHGQDYYGLETLVAAFAADEESWKDATAHVSRGYITKWLESNEDYDNSVRIEKIREEAGSDTDLVVFRIVYTFNRELPFAFSGKLITLQNLFLFAGKTLRKEMTKGEGEVTDALVNGKMLRNYNEFRELTGKENSKLFGALESIQTAMASKGTYQEKLTQAVKFLDVVLHDARLTEEDAGLARAIYTYFPDMPFETHGGIKCKTLEEIGNAIESEKAYYMDVLVNNKDANLYTFIDVKGSGRAKTLQHSNMLLLHNGLIALFNLRHKGEHNTIIGSNKMSELQEEHNYEIIFNKIVLELQGWNKCRVGDLVFCSPDDLLNADEEIRQQMVKFIADPKSKLSVWLGQFEHLRMNIDEWRGLGRHNITTLTYALEKGSPFHFTNGPASSLDEFTNLFAENLKNKAFSSEIALGSLFVQEAEFWLKNYQNADFIDIVIDFLQQALKASNAFMVSPEMVDSCAKLVIKNYEKSSDKAVFGRYWENIRPLLDGLYREKKLSPELFELQMKILIGRLEGLVYEASSTVDRNTKKKYVDWLKELNTKHPWVIRYAKEERLYAGELRSISVSLDEEKRINIDAAEWEHRTALEKKKDDAKNNYKSSERRGLKDDLGCMIIGAILFGVIGASAASKVPLLCLIFISIGFGPVVVRGYKAMTYYSDRSDAVSRVEHSAADNEKLEIKKRKIEQEIDERKLVLKKEVLREIYNMNDKEISAALAELT
jgi:serine/threonine protein kinase